ncbi:rhomboid family intramembrane serine protease [Stackebrandtia soli]|uniref:rhomboid family intramembrane serine protease n=1 Tax=Stackebrandtia soli TaxID=1892856 RepID=UPI0039EB4219
MPTPSPRLLTPLRGALIVTAAVVVMWAVEAIDQVFGAGFDSYGILARDVSGLPGIVTAPFLHSGYDHLASNSVPLIVLGGLAASRGLARFLAATAIIVLVGGAAVWLTSPDNTITIGASGLVFGYFGYLLTRAVLERRVLDIVIAVVCVVFYGSILWGVLPGTPGVSWQGHLFGLCAGVLAAWMLKRPRAVPTATTSPTL